VQLTGVRRTGRGRSSRVGGSGASISKGLRPSSTGSAVLSTPCTRHSRTRCASCAPDPAGSSWSPGAGERSP
jgi:hypothetical protein